MNSNQFPDIPKEKFEFVKREKGIHDEKFETKPVGYFKDALIRFSKNKGSVVATIIIFILLLFAIFAPIFSNYSIDYADLYYKNVLPKSNLFSKMGFWDGTTKETVNSQMYDYYSAIPGAIEKVYKVEESGDGRRKSKYYTIKLDTYDKVGYQYKTVTKKGLDKIIEYEKANNIQILYPMIDTSKIKAKQFKNDPNFWYVADAKANATRTAKDELQPNYIKSDDSLRNDGYAYWKKYNENQYQVRVLYKEYYYINHGYYPSFIFGCDAYGQDIWVRLAGGARFSFLLGIVVALTNIIIGVIYGSIEGYYGGAVDMLMERISDILSAVPFIVVATLFQLHLGQKVGIIGCLLFAFILTGWIGVARRTRTQFYRFKGQEYVLAARTLGAKDSRLIFKHILPNSLGTLITSSILMIPSVIFSESFLSYLGIVNLQSKYMTSVGTLLSNGQGVLSTFPHIIFFPALFISLLMISFNIFGNGLRDAFNPSLRGAEE